MLLHATEKGTSYYGLIKLHHVQPTTFQTFNTREQHSNNYWHIYHLGGNRVVTCENATTKY